MPLTHIEESLFGDHTKTNETVVLVHGCNCYGVWRRGIAGEMKERYPDAYEDYRSHSRSRSPQSLRGTARLFKAHDGNIIASLYTSIEYEIPDMPDKILEASDRAIFDMIDELNRKFEGESNPKIYSNKFNSGIFLVPWEDTEAVIKRYVKDVALDWTVCEPKEFKGLKPKATVLS